MRLVSVISHALGQLISYLPQGRYAGLMIRFAGTNQAAQTLANTELGRLRLIHQGQEIVNMEPVDLINLSNLYGGTPENASAVGAAYTFSMIVPFRTKHDLLNVLSIKPQETQIIIDGFNTAKVASGTIEVYAILAEGVERYVPILKQNNIGGFSAAMTQQYPFPVPNIEQLYVRTDANLSRAKVLRDGQPVVDGTFAALDAASDLMNQVETGITLVELVAPRSEAFQNVQQTVLEGVATAALTSNTLFSFYLAIAPFQN